MIAMLATVVDTEALRDTVLASLVAGIGISIVFSLAIYGVSRSIDSSRDGRRAAAAAFAGLGVLGLLASSAAIVIGIIVMTSK
jgi:hypothetical protein